MAYEGASESFMFLGWEQIIMMGDTKYGSPADRSTTHISCIYTVKTNTYPSCRALHLLQYRILHRIPLNSTLKCNLHFNIELHKIG